MPLTDHSPIFGSFHEEGFNRIIRHVMLQRPSMFNYATPDLIHPTYEPRLCEPIKFHPAVAQFGNPLVTSVPYMPVIGYDGPFGMSYSLQLREVEIDFHPGNVIALPPELNPPLGAQQIALRAKACFGMGCPEQRYVSVIQAQHQPTPVTSREKHDDKPGNPPDRPFPAQKLNCFCLEICAVVRFARNGRFIELQLLGLEIKDIRPEGLENMIECYLRTVLQLTIFPKLRIALTDLVFDIGSFVTILPTPISGTVPFNPAVENDRISVFFNLN